MSGLYTKYIERGGLMIRFLLSLIILTLIITYLIIPAVKYIEKFFSSEGKRIDKAFTNNKEKDDEK